MLLCIFSLFKHQSEASVFSSSNHSNKYILKYFMICSITYCPHCCSVMIFIMVIDHICLRSDDKKRWTFPEMNRQVCRVWLWIEIAATWIYVITKVIFLHQCEARRTTEQVKQLQTPVLYTKGAVLGAPCPACIRCAPALCAWMKFPHYQV